MISQVIVDDVIAEVVRWSETFIERPHPIFGGLPVCPFARAARLKRTIRFDVRPFSEHSPLDPQGALMTLIADFARDPRLETFFVIHPDRRGLTALALERLVGRLNGALAATPALAGLRAFEAHPDSTFRVGDLYTRRSPYPSFQVLENARLKATSDTLLHSPYYARFTADMLRAVGMPRD